ncbi:hypothetical protein [Vibrio sp. EA2]|uniref:hypothetical protein n=1 Tax=Vibrio sp. EA2 TaxID=3079860 RepID=UPI002948F4E1|nr:hypothetical protein [Vibrio sp. EA2]MDV6250073.1 hypothetical protein [Vibrio sp. EA2]
MKKFILAAAVAGVLAGCSADDVEDAFSTELSSTEAREAADDILAATGWLVADIVEKCELQTDPTNCAINGNEYNPDEELMDVFTDRDDALNLKVVYDSDKHLITLTSDNSGKYFEYDNFLKISYSSSSSLKHKLVIDVTDVNHIIVDFDAHNIIDDKNFGSSGESLEYVQNGDIGLLTGVVRVSEDEFECISNTCR